MKNKKYIFAAFSFYDYTGIEKHLEEMAAKGWLINKISGLFFVFKKIQPTKMKFSVHYFSKSSEFDPGLNKDEMTFHEFCEHTGWKLACSRAQLHIFYNENENAVPIETDPIMKIESMHKAIRKSYLPAYFTLLAIAILQGSMFLSSLVSEPISLLANTTSLFSGIVWTMLFVLCSVEILGYYLWKYKAKKAAEQGEFLPSKGHKKFQIFVLCVVVISFVFWVVTYLLFGSPLLRIIGTIMILYMLLLIVLVNGVKIFLKKKNASRTINRTLTWTASFVLSFIMMFAIGLGILHAVQSDKIEADIYNSGNTISKYYEIPPLTAEDLYGVSMNDYICERTGNESLLLAQYTTHQYSENDLPELDYTITFMKKLFLFELCKNSLVNENRDEVVEGKVMSVQHYEPIEKEPWEAMEAYRWRRDNEFTNKYLLIYENHMVEIEFSNKPTKEQTAVVTSALSDIY